MTLVLHERGLFSWPEWVSTLAAEIAGADPGGDADDYDSAYYRHWLAAIERLVVDKGATTSGHLDARRDAWDRAAHATPHGQPILLGQRPALHWTVLSSKMTKRGSERTILTAWSRSSFTSSSVS